GCVDPHLRTIRVKLQDIGTILLPGCCVRVVDIRSRTHRDKHFLAVPSKLNVPSPVTFARRDTGEVRGFPAGFRVAIPVGKTHDGTRVPHVNPLWIGARGIEVDAEGPIQAGRKNAHHFRFSLARDASKDPDVAGTAFGNEEISVRSGTNQTGLIQSRGILLDLETRRDLWPCTFRTRYQLGPVAC